MSYLFVWNVNLEICAELVDRVLQSFSENDNSTLNIYDPSKVLFLSSLPHMRYT